MKKSISIIGGGTAGLFAAAFINTDLYEVTIYEKKSTAGRKFLVAGDGGFNLTHGEGMDTFSKRYLPLAFLDNSLTHFTNDRLREWLAQIGIPTFAGSSNRVFPEKDIKPIAVLKKIIQFLEAKKVQFKFEYEFKGWNKKEDLVFNNAKTIKSDYTIFAMGGASWKITGSDGKWSDLFEKNGVSVVPFRASNCAFEIQWETDFISKHEGTPFKNIAIKFNEHIQKGEIVITQFGIEGNAIYALSPFIQDQLAINKQAIIHIDFKPTVSQETLLEKMKDSAVNTSQTLRKILKLSAAKVVLIKRILSKEDFLNKERLIESIKNFPLIISASASIDEAISTTGGISFSSLNTFFELKNRKNSFVIGEMVDWNAPTGGYLLQGCISMGVYVAGHLNKMASDPEQVDPKS